MYLCKKLFLAEKIGNCKKMSYRNMTRIQPHRFFCVSTEKMASCRVIVTNGGQQRPPRRILVLAFLLSSSFIISCYISVTFHIILLSGSAPAELS